MSTVTLTGARWSSAVVCAKQAAYQALDVEGEPYPEETLLRFGRGRRIGKAMAEEVIETLAAKGREGIPEYEVDWGPEGVWTGHVDVMEIDDGEPVKPIEVVSQDGLTLPRRKALQVAGYAIFLDLPEASVLVVDRASDATKTYTFPFEPFRAEVEAIVEAVSDAYTGGTLPERFDGAAPGAWPCMECPWRVGCFDGYTPPPAGRLPGKGDRLARLVDLERAIKSTPRGDHVVELEAERDAIREELRGHMTPGEDYIEEGVKVRRTQVNGRRSFDFASAAAAGYEIPADLAQFVSGGKGFDKWTVREVGS